MTTSTPPIPDAPPHDTISHLDEHIDYTPKTSAALHPSDDSKSSGSSSGMDTPLELTHGKSSMDARSKISSLLKDKEQEWTAVAAKKGPLQFLDLPLDVLKEIVKEVTHTNDLTALALAHSALHNLAIPHIYSRFDIVWPDAHATTDPRTGVDALTYGLATLCMGNISTPTFQDQFPCSNCGTLNVAECNHGLALGPQNEQRRLGNHYPQFTRKFSLGNGPADWVQEYLITKESGKMLGTLVALAVARMINLETFVWDMPTGVLRDVWMALSSLQTRNPTRDCRLERVWVRWHDNSESSSLPPGPNTSPAVNSTNPSSNMTAIGWAVPAGSGPGAHSLPLSYSQARVEYPTLSVLPPLKSLSVLDIDELDYLDEMSVLISKSKDRLRELRVGISEKAYKRDFANAWDGPHLHQVDHNASWPGESTIGDKRLGGVLGVLLGRVFDIRKNKKAKNEKRDRVIDIAAITPNPPVFQTMESHITGPMDIQNGDSLQEYAPEIPESDALGVGSENKTSNTSEGTIMNPGVAFNINGQPLTSSPTIFDLNAQTEESGVAPALSDIDSLTALISGHSISTPTEEPDHSTLPLDTVVSTNSEIDLPEDLATPHIATTTQQSNHNIIPPEPPMETPLRRSQSQSQKQLHFSDIQSSERERLEGKLRLQTLELERVPLSVAVLQKGFDWSVLTNLTILDCQQHDRLWIMLRKHFQPSSLNGGHSSKHTSSSSLQYHLSLKKVHTDAASPALISFLKETLAPNTLETLFLQDRKRSSGTNVTIDAIYRGPLKRHRGSLRKLMLDSSNGIPRGPTSSSENPRWKAWMPNRDVVNFITSGRMSSLRELSMAIDYKDWHHFLQRLPQVPHLRSLNIPFIADHVTPAFDPRELAMQVVDVIYLRPEVELCYMGVSHKCFEILENRPHDESHSSTDTHSSLANGGPGGAITDDDDGSDDEGSEEDDDDDDEEDDNGTATAPQIDPEETESELSDHDDSDSDSDGSDDGRLKVRLRLREILFYDDKVAIFKARHGKL